MIIYDTIGMHFRAASRMGLDWSGFVPVLDPMSLVIADIVDAESAGCAARFRFVQVNADGTWAPGGQDAVIPVLSSGGDIAVA